MSLTEPLSLLHGRLVCFDSLGSFSRHERDRREGSEDGK